jgi:hypothetical protein
VRTLATKGSIFRKAALRSGFLVAATTLWLACVAGDAPAIELSNPIDAGFTTALKEISNERATNSANEFGCTQFFATFRSLNQIGPIVDYFRAHGISAIVADQNREHFVYFEFPYATLREWGYRGFRRGDRLVLVFTTAGAGSDTITSFSARLLGSDVP